jgi:hypothetical protein
LLTARLVQRSVTTACGPKASWVVAIAFVGVGRGVLPRRVTTGSEGEQRDEDEQAAVHAVVTSPSPPEVP